MQTQQAAIVAIFAVVVIVCCGVVCFTTYKIVKSSLDGCDSAHRARILREVPKVLQHLPMYHWRRK
ncbi:hypothetical protein ACIGMX_18875 [Streptomyces aquilus]|uniref:hypothetical protein n=1 Tax=Streptomyces aquilus TaxID=2548456 RepID=UPI00104776CF